MTDTFNMVDDFSGDNAELVSCIEALLHLNSLGALVPTGVCGHAVTLLQSATVRLSALDHKVGGGEEGCSSRITGQDLCADAGSLPALVGVPVAWRYEFATPRQEDGYRDGTFVWHVGFSAEPPTFEVRNLTPLYEVAK